MTNGEKLQEIFPQGIIYFSGTFLIFSIDGYNQSFSPSWWDSEYKEPVTNNVLAAEFCSHRDADMRGGK